MKKAGNILTYFVILFLSIVFIFYGNQYISHISRQQSHEGLQYHHEEELDTLTFARIVSVDERKQSTYDADATEIRFTAQPFTWKEIFKGQKSQENLIHGSQIINDDSKNIVQISAGDKVVLLLYGENYYFQYYFRLDKIVILAFILMMGILLLGGIKGFHTIVTLTLTCFSIFLVFIPSIKAGYNIYFCTNVICLYIIIMTFTMIYGINKKSSTAMISCIAGVIFSVGISAFAGNWMRMTGFINEDMHMMNNLLGIDVDVKAILFSMITIGALGAIMDVAMSITSSLCELKENNQKITASELLISGLHIGRDIMGTMANTLILAYIGSSMIGVLVYAASNYPLISIFNKEDIVFEFLQSLIGSLSLLFTLPFTAIVASMMLSYPQSRKRKYPRY